MKTERLCVVMPVYNEEEAIGTVLEKWTVALKSLGIDFEIRPYNDGSKDGSLKVMRETASRLGTQISVRDKPNGGHGNTILTGYREAAADGFDWVFQIDSDDEMGPEMFGELWARRNDYDFLVGIRDGRVQALPRKIVSFVSRLCVRVFYGKGVWDVNTPYRLMRVSAFQAIFQRIPLTTFAPNVILSGLAARYRLRCFETQVPQHDRTTGEVSIKKWKLLKAAAKSFRQTIFFAVRTARLRDVIRYFFWGAAWAFCCICVVVGFRNGFREYDFQWDPAKILMMGDNPYLYSLEHRPVPYQGFMSPYIEANQIPSCLLLLAPWTLLPQLLANQVWDVCNLLFTAVFLLFTYRSFFAGTKIRDGFFWIPLLLLTGTPWRNVIGTGQHLMFSLAFFMPAYYYQTKGRSTLSGVLLALSAFKYTTIGPLAFLFIWKRWWKPLIIAALLHIAATIGCGLYVGESPVTLVVQSLQVGAQLTGQGLADVASLVRTLGWGSDAAVATLGYTFFGLLLVVLALKRTQDDLLDFAILSVISNVMFYHRIYDFIVLIFPVVYWFKVHAVSHGVLWRIIEGLIFANVLFIFYLQRGFFAFGVDALPVVVVLEHALLFALLIKRIGHQNDLLRLE